MPPTPTRGKRVFTPGRGVGGEETRDLNAASKEGNGARSVASVVATAGHRFPRSRASRHHPANQSKQIWPWDAGFTGRKGGSSGDEHESRRQPPRPHPYARHPSAVRTTREEGKHSQPPLAASRRRPPDRGRRPEVQSPLRGRRRQRLLPYLRLGPRPANGDGRATEQPHRPRRTQREVPPPIFRARGEGPDPRRPLHRRRGLSPAAPLGATRR
nr:uncharacterized protein LOC127328922 [Lolium perenne]